MSDVPTSPSGRSATRDRREVAVETSSQALGRYTLHGALARGGMATVHFGRLVGAADFARIVAVKRLHPQFAGEPDFVAMFLDEARLAARIQHPNVVAPLDVAEASGEILVVFDYIHGESLSKLLALARRRAPPSLQVVSGIVAGLLHGLHAAHEATGPAGEPLGIVHRDVSPQNVLVGADGVARLIDFGVAKARARLQTTREGEIKGKLAYMAPEQLRGRTATPQSDIYAAGVVLWEALTGCRLFAADNEGAVIERVLIGLVEAPSTLVPAIPEALDAVALRAIDRDPAERFADARAMAEALEAAMPPASSAEVAAWVNDTASEALAARAEQIARIEREEGLSSERRGRAFLAGLATSSDEAPAPPPRLGARALALAFALGAVGLGALAAVALASAMRSGTVPVTVEANARGREPSPATAEASPPTTTPALIEAPPPATSVIAAPTATMVSVVAAPSARATASAARPRSRPTVARPDCKVAYTLDAAGRKNYKRECL